MIPVVIQLLVAGVLLYAAGGKIVSPGEHLAALRSSRTVPGVLLRPIATAVVVAELAIGVAVLGLRGPSLSYALGAAAALGALFAIWAASVRLRGLRIRCGCFGASSKDVTWITSARALLLAGAAALGAVLVRADGAWVLPDSGYSFLSALGLATVLVLFGGFWRARGTLLLTGESLKGLRSLSSDVRT